MRLCVERCTRSVTRALQSRGRSFHVVYLIARIILGQVLLSAALAGGLVVVVGGLWFVFPQWHQRAKRL